MQADFILQTKHLESHLFQEKNFCATQKFLCEPILAWKRVRFFHEKKEVQFFQDSSFPPSYYQFSALPLFFCHTCNLNTRELPTSLEHPVLEQ